MSKKTDAIGADILRLIGEAGGSLSAADLRDKMPNIADANRSYHTRKLVAEGRLTATGKTNDRAYILAEPGSAPAPGQRVPSGKKPKKDGKKLKGKAAAQKVDALTARLTSAIAARPASTAKIAAQVTGVMVSMVDTEALRRVLRLALSAPGDIPDADRQALHAVASAA